jgi:hypothetical protein
VVGGDPLLEEALALDPVRITDPGQSTVVEVRQQRRSDPGVVVDDLALGEAGLGIEDLVEVRDRQPAAVDLYFAAFARDLLFALVAGFFVEAFFAGVLAFVLRSAPPLSSSPLIAASDSSSAAIRSGALVAFGASGAAARTSSPAAVRSISDSSSERY